MQPVIVQTWYDNGFKSFVQHEMSVNACQTALDNNIMLTSDEYDSFWLGYWDAVRQNIG